MIDVTKYLKENGYSPTHQWIRNFLRLERVKYQIKKYGYKYECRSGRYGGTKFCAGLFALYKRWLNREPIPLLNRKEYEVGDFIKSLFGKDNINEQYLFNGYVYDWHIPEINLFIEFNEATHNLSRITAKDRKKRLPNQFVIRESHVMNDLASLTKYYINKIK